MNNFKQAECVQQQIKQSKNLSLSLCLTAPVYMP